MLRRTTTVSFLGLLALAVTLSALAAKPPSWKGSWADARNIWIIPQDLSADFEVCRPFNSNVIACGTEDGGRTWHPIMRDSGQWKHARVLRTSPSTGVLADKTGHRFLDVDHYWTADAGHHWHRTSIFGRGVVRLVGRGRYLYWDIRGSIIYRVRSWPPRGPITCPEGWRYDLANREAALDAWGAVCLNPPAGSGLRSVVARRLGRHFIRDAASVAHGAAWVLAPLEYRRPVVLMMRHGRQRILRLPRARAPRETTDLSGLEIYTEWPYIAVTALAWDRRSDPRHDLLLGCVFWESRNGGKGWTSHTEEIGKRWDQDYCNF